MKYYLDINLLSDADISLGFLWQKIYQQVHIALADNKVGENSSDIALCFPECTLGSHKNNVFPLGAKLRIFAPTRTLLDKLSIGNWLKRFNDYVNITDINNVPEIIEEFVCVKRIQFKTNFKRLAYRRSKQKGETLEQSIEYYAGFEHQESKLPFISVNSLQTRQQFRLFIQQNAVNKPVFGRFTCYGLSKDGTTVPWF